MKQYSLLLLLLLFLAGTATAQTPKTLNKRKLSSVKPSTSASGPVQSGNRTSNATTVVTNKSTMVNPVSTLRMKVKLPFAATEREFTVKKVGHHYILNGDIIVGDDFPKTMSLAHSNPDYRWPNAVMPILIDASVYSNGKGPMVHAAIEEFNTRTVLCLKPRTTESDFVRIVFSSEVLGAGSSRVGKQGGEQIIFLGDSADKGTVMHEVMHAAGFYHEQNRDDRDEFIQIFMENVDPKASDNFQKEGGMALGGYDYCSIMHYHGKAFLNDEPAYAGKSTIICIKDIETCKNCLGQRDGFSGQDLLGIEQFYGKVNGPKCNLRFPNPIIPQFASVNIPESDKAQQMFRHRAEYASKNGFAAGFPNFHEARIGNDIVGGTILIKHGMVEWRDVPQSFFPGAYPLNDFVTRMSVTQDYAVARGFVGGFPNYFHANYGSGNVCGTFLLTNAVAEYRNVSFIELGNPPRNDIRQMFTSVNDYAFRNGYLGGFPTFKISQYTSSLFCGVILIKKEAGEWRDVILSTGPR